MSHTKSTPMRTLLNKKLNEQYSPRDWTPILKGQDAHRLTKGHKSRILVSYTSARNLKKIQIVPISKAAQPKP